MKIDIFGLYSLEELITTTKKVMEEFRVSEDYSVEKRKRFATLTVFFDDLKA